MGDTPGQVITNLIIWALIFYGIYRAYRWWQKKQAIKAAGPGMTVIPAFDKGPMKVDISLQQVPANSSKHVLFGGDNWWRMHFNVRMSDEDWKLFQKSGLIERELFSYPGIEFPDVDTSFTGHHLKYMPNYKDFPDIHTAEAAKERLIKSLHTIRSQVDEMKSSRSGGGPERERIEI